MIILEETNKITKNHCTLTISEINTNHCQVDCTGRKNKWTHIFPSIYADYAMLRDKCLIDLPGKSFLVYQINEHSKGGHHEYEVQLMDVSGNVLNEFSSRDNIDFIIDNTNLWFLKTGNKRFSFTSDTDLDLIKLNIKTGEVRNSINLDYQKILNCPYKIVIGAKLSKKRNNMMLKIQYKDKSNNSQSKHIPLSSDIFRLSTGHK